MIADSEEKLQRLLKVVAKESERLDLKINCDKTHVLVASKKGQAPVSSVAVNSVQIKQIDHFCFKVLRQLDNIRWDIRYGY